MDLTGNRYGQWTVLEDNKERLNGTVAVKCQCDCGTVKLMIKSPFISGYNSTKCAQCNKKIVGFRLASRKK